MGSEQNGKAVTWGATEDCDCREQNEQDLFTSGSYGKEYKKKRNIIGGSTLSVHCVQPLVALGSWPCMPVCVQTVPFSILFLGRQLCSPSCPCSSSSSSLRPRNPEMESSTEIEMTPSKCVRAGRLLSFLNAIFSTPESPVFMLQEAFETAPKSQSRWAPGAPSAAYKFGDDAAYNTSAVGLRRSVRQIRPLWICNPQVSSELKHFRFFKSTPKVRGPV